MNIAFVDDDIEMVELLSHLINWEDFGCKVVAQGFSGADILKQVGDGSLDLLIADITMPNMDGFELALTLRKNNPHMQVIFLTCHDDFDYAKEAIRVGANDYLIKYSLTKESLCIALEKSIERYNTLVENHLKNPLLLRQELFLSLLKTTHKANTNKAEPAEIAAIQQHIQNLHITIFDPPHKQVHMGCLYCQYDAKLLAKDIPTDDFPLWFNLAHHILNECRKTDHRNEWEIFPLNDQLILLSTQKLTAEEPRSFWTALETIQQKMLQESRQISCTTTDPISTCLDLNKIPAAFTDLQKNRDNSFYAPYFCQLEEKRTIFTDFSADQIDYYLQECKLIFKNSQNFDQQMEELHKRLLKYNYKPSMVRKLVQLNILHIYQQTLRFCTDVRAIQVEGMSFNFCMQALKTQYDWYAQAYNQHFNKNQNPHIKSVLQYIDDHLSEPLSLNQVAEKMHKNSSYLSRLFKQHTGMSFSDYLHKRRVERATYLLEETEISFEDVGLEIGIQNLSYFFRFYKRETGKTPGSVRNRE